MASATTPILPPPPGVTPDFEGRSSVQNTLIIVFSVFLGLSTAFLGLRLYTVLRIIRRFGLDEGEPAALPCPLHRDAPPYIRLFCVGCILIVPGCG